MGSSWGFAVAVTTTLWACGAEPGDVAHAPDREALLSLRGTVVASERPLDDRLVPALMFAAYVTNWGHTEFIVSGEHEGTFTTAFTLHIYDPLPDEALTVLTRGEPALAMGGITGVAPNHPRSLQWNSDGSGHSSVCTDSGECGVPAANPCDPSLGRTCLGTIVAGKDWGDHGVAGRYLVLYLSEPAPAGSVYSQFFAMGKPMAAGYNVIRHQSVLESLSTAQQSAYFECIGRATATALSQFNLDHGTTYADHSLIADGGRQRDIQLLADWDGMMIASTVSEGCVLPGAQQLVDRTDETLELVLVNWGN